MITDQLPQPVRREHAHDETDSEGSWAISYGDMVTLLLTFFILFFSTDQKQAQTDLQLQKTILAEFGDQSEIAKRDDGLEPARMKMGDVKNGEIDEAILKDWGGIASRMGDRIVVEFPSINFYDFAKIDVNSKGQQSLSKFAKKYIQFAGSHSLSVKAYTDSVPVLNQYRFHDNLELSALRSIAAMRILQRSGIPLDRMRIAGNGESVTSRKPNSTAINSENPLARKVILVIEPMTKEKL
jgi:chemotaxis protein MotB